MSDSNESTCAVILDVNWFWWARLLETSPENDADDSLVWCILDSVIAYCGSFLLQNLSNKLLLLTAGTDGCDTVFPTPPQPAKAGVSFSDPQSSSGASLLAGSSVGPFDAKLVRKSLYETMTRAIAASEEDVETDTEQHMLPVPETLIAGCLAKALCYMNRLTKDASAQGGGQRRIEHRILIIKLSDDTTSQYMSLMNAFFTAQKAHIIIDACLLFQSSTILEQACDITGGICFRAPAIPPLLQYLVTLFSSSASLRSHMVLPSSGDIDYRAACFCHQRLIDFGFVCSVCLSIYCEWRPICGTCDTVFRLPFKPPAAKKRRKAGSLTPSASMPTLGSVG